jgi:hypothetical protein
MEKPSGVSFGTFQLLGDEYGLFDKICVDRHRLSIDGGSTCSRVGITFASVKGSETHQTRALAVPGDFVVQHDTDRGCAVCWRRAGRTVPVRRFGCPGGSEPRREPTGDAKRETSRGTDSDFELRVKLRLRVKRDGRCG